MSDFDMTKIEALEKKARDDLVKNADLLFRFGDKILLPILKSRNKSGSVGCRIYLRANILKCLLGGDGKKVMRDMIDDEQILTAIKLPGMILLKIGDGK